MTSSSESAYNLVYCMYSLLTVLMYNFVAFAFTKALISHGEVLVILFHCVTILDEKLCVLTYTSSTNKPYVFPKIELSFSMQ